MSVESDIPSKRELCDLDDDGNRIEPGMWKVKSQGRSGFDEVTRPDYFAAQSAAKVHKRATGNECNIVPVYE